MDRTGCCDDFSEGFGCVNHNCLEGRSCSTMYVTELDGECVMVVADSGSPHPIWPTRIQSNLTSINIGSQVDTGLHFLLINDIEHRIVQCAKDIIAVPLGADCCSTNAAIVFSRNNQDYRSVDFHQQLTASSDDYARVHQCNDNLRIAVANDQVLIISGSFDDNDDDCLISANWISLFRIDVIDDKLVLLLTGPANDTTVRALCSSRIQVTRFHRDGIYELHDGTHLSISQNRWNGELTFKLPDQTIRYAGGNFITDSDSD